MQVGGLEVQVVVVIVVELLERVIKDKKLVLVVTLKLNLKGVKLL